jgi:hypothetical protein
VHLEGLSAVFGKADPAYVTETLDWLRGVVLHLRRVLVDGELPLAEATDAEAWLVSASEAAKPEQASVQFEAVAHRIAEMNRKTGLRWVVRNESVRVQYRTSEGPLLDLPVRAESTIGIVADALVRIERLTGVPVDDLWRMVLLGEEPVVSSARARIGEASFESPGITPRHTYSVSLDLFSPRISARAFRGLPLFLRSIWGRVNADSEGRVVQLVNETGVLPEEGFEWGDRKRFWEEIARQAENAGVVSKRGSRAYTWQGVEKAYHRREGTEVGVRKK